MFQVLKRATADGMTILQIKEAAEAAGLSDFTDNYKSILSAVRQSVHQVSVLHVRTESLASSPSRFLVLPLGSRLASPLMSNKTRMCSEVLCWSVGFALNAQQWRCAGDHV